MPVIAWKIAGKIRRPCACCPWRVDAPRGYWDPSHFVEIWSGCQDDGAHPMACHGSTARKYVPCQGWVRVLGYEAIGVRLAVMTGQVSSTEVEDDGGPVLFPTFAAMLRAEGIRPPRRNKRRPPRRLRGPTKKPER